MICPHCGVTIDAVFVIHELDPIRPECTEHWSIAAKVCPACGRKILRLITSVKTPVANQPGVFQLVETDDYGFVLPRHPFKRRAQPEVPKKYAEDYREASVVLQDSTNASAALSRRCLQTLLRDEVKVKNGTLHSEITEVLDSELLPSYIMESLDVIRNTGNFAAHPIKSKVTGEILPVEAGEAEWNLEVLELLFDFLFVKPARTEAKKSALNKKLQEAGKPLLKEPKK